MINRRHFFHAAGLIAAGIVLSPTPGRAAARHRCVMAPLGPHPVPRSGITGAKVLAKEKLHDPKLVSLFDGVREIPGVVDGIRCNCGCAGTTGFYSLLSCYEGDAMARHCPVCQGQGRLATRLHKEGKSLDDIRVAIDAQFGA